MLRLKANLGFLTLLLPRCCCWVVLPNRRQHQQAATTIIHDMLVSLSALPTTCRSTEETTHGDGGKRPNGSRREWLLQSMTTTTTKTTAFLWISLLSSTNADAADFTPGGTLVDRPVGVTVGNPEASPSRKPDNSNVLFDKDYYFKFGTAAVWIEPDSTSFPATMPFTKAQQRYDALKKYRDRIISGIDRMKEAVIKNSGSDSSLIPDPAAVGDFYQLRPMGLLANAMLASENSGAPNELFLARWYINEMHLIISDVRNIASTDGEGGKERQRLSEILKKAINSYLTLLNRVITPKVGEKFEYV